MTRRGIAAQLRTVVVSVLRCPPARVVDGADFRADLRASDTALAALPLALQESFGVTFTDREIGFCQTVGTVADLIEHKLEKGA